MGEEVEKLKDALHRAQVAEAAAAAMAEQRDEARQSEAELEQACKDLDLRIEELEAAVESNTKALGFAQNGRRAAEAQVEALMKALERWANKYGHDKSDLLADTRALLATAALSAPADESDLQKMQSTPAEESNDNSKIVGALQDAVAGKVTLRTVHVPQAVESSIAPAGWVLVPREPTEDMLRECFHAVTKRTLGEHNCMMLALADRRTAHDFKAKMRWRAMLAAVTPAEESSVEAPAALEDAFVAELKLWLEPRLTGYDVAWTSKRMAERLVAIVSSAPAEARSARVHASDCQSHIVDVRGRPDPCTCGLAGGDHG